MYYMNHDAVDYFRVDFTPDESIVRGKYYPLGIFAAEALECGWNVSGEIHRMLKRFQEEFQVFLAARDASSAATALHAMRQLWKVLEELPLYNKLLAGDYRMSGLIPYLRRHPDILDEMMTPGTPRNEAYTRWMGKLERLEMTCVPLSELRSGCWRSSFKSFLPGGGRTTSRPMPVTGASWKRQ